MKNNIYKKLFSFLTLIVLISSSMSVQALTLVQPNSNFQKINTTNLQSIKNFKAVKPAYNPKIIMDKKVGSFVINTKPLVNKEVLELTPVTASNAGKVLKTWSVSNNFKRNFVVKPTGSNFNALVLKLNEKGLKEVLTKTNEMKSTYAKYKNIGIGQLQVQTPTLQRLPDRLVLTNKSIIKFKTKKEFDNIKKYYKLNKATIYQTLSKKINLNNPHFNAPKTNFKLEDFYKDFYYHCKITSPCKTTLAGKLGISVLALYNRAYKDSDAKIIEELILNDNSESEIVNEEKIEISLIPVDPLSQNNFNFNLRKDPKLVRIPSLKINNVFKNIKAVTGINQQLFDAFKAENDLKEQLEKVCNTYSGSEKTACEKLAQEYIKPEPKNYEKILINGITIGNEYKYSFYRKWRKSFLGRKVTIYEVDVSLEFGYGFGIRIPIKAKININRPVIRKDTQDKRFKATIEVKTIDATARQYRDAGIDNSQIFDGKEFVFTVYAYVKGKLVLVNHTVFNKTYDLIALLGELLHIDGLHSFDKSKNFTPPFAGNNLITLLEKEFGIPIYSKSFGIGGGTIYGDVLFQVFIDGYIKAYCKTLNAVGSSCNRDLEFRSVAPKVLQLEAIKNTHDKKNNQIGTYNEYGIILKDFRYIPQLVAAIKSRARLHWWYDIKFRDDSGDISTPRYEIYRFTLDLPELGAHVGYGIGGRYELTEEQKQIKATENKFYQTLKEILEDPIRHGTIHINDGVIGNGVDGYIGNGTDGKIDTGKIGNIGNIGGNTSGKKPGKVDSKIPGRIPGRGDLNGNLEFTKICTMEYMPVCGEKDGVQKTYSNKCVMRVSGATLVKVGKCENSGNGNPGDNGSGYTPAGGEEEYTGDEYTGEDNSGDDYYPGVEWRPSEPEDIPEDISSMDTSRGGLLDGKWIYPEDLELRFVPKTAIPFVQNFFNKRTPAKRAKIYSQVLTMIETYENNPVLRVKKARLINILKDLRDIMVVYRLR